ncbi:MAG: hypothetical protein IKI67_00270 [Bacteroidales bacterium]|nr:hypothetical protein [Bacteroidales bacterium]
MLLGDFIKSQVGSATKGVDIPSDLKGKVLGGLSESIIGSITQTASEPGGLDAVKNLLTGKANAVSSPITALAGNLFTDNILKKLGLGQAAGKALSGLIPTIIGSLSGFLKDQDGDGDVDLKDVIMSLTNTGSSAGGGGGILGGILGGLFGNKK